MFTPSPPPKRPEGAPSSGRPENIGRTVKAVNRRMESQNINKNNRINNMTDEEKEKYYSRLERMRKIMEDRTSEKEQKLKKIEKAIDESLESDKNGKTWCDEDDKIIEIIQSESDIPIVDDEYNSRKIELPKLDTSSKTINKKIDLYLENVLMHENIEHKIHKLNRQDATKNLLALVAPQSVKDSLGIHKYYKYNSNCGVEKSLFGYFKMYDKAIEYCRDVEERLKDTPAYAKLFEDVTDPVRRKKHDMAIWYLKYQLKLQDDNKHNKYFCEDYKQRLKDGTVNEYQYRRKGNDLYLHYTNDAKLDTEIKIKCDL